MTLLVPRSSENEGANPLSFAGRSDLQLAPFE